MENQKILSNNIGFDDSPVDRIYGSPASGGNLKLIQADYTEYKGKIFKKTLILKGIDGNNFRSHCFVTDDGRWFDRAGIPMLAPPDTIEVEEEDNTNED